MVQQNPQVPPHSGHGPTSSRHAWLVGIVLATLTLLVFGQTVRHDFIDYDDGDYVYDNAVVRAGLTADGVAWAFAGVHASNWHPLTWLSHMLDCQLFGLEPGGHHATSVLIHAAVAVLLFLVLRAATVAPWRSAVAAALFAVHPLRVESVAWVAERKDVLSGLFFVLTLGAWLRYAAQPSLPRYLVVGASLALGLMAKPMLVSVPVVLFLFDVWPLRRLARDGDAVRAGVSPRRALLEQLPLTALCALSAAITLVVQAGAMANERVAPLGIRVGNALVAYVVYLRQLLWPSDLALFYPLDLAGPSAGAVTLAVVLLAAITAVAVAWRSSRPYLLVGWLAYLVMALPVIGLVQVGMQAHADRYTYLPLLGPTVALVWLAADALRALAGVDVRRAATTSTALAAASVLALAIAAWRQTARWRDSETIWRHTLAHAAPSFVAANNLATALTRAGRESEAFPWLEQAVALHPSPAALTNLGGALQRRGRGDEALALLEEALRLDPDFVEARLNLASSLAASGRHAEALEQYRRALTDDPGSVEVLNNFAWYLATCPDDAIRDGRGAVELAERAADATEHASAAVLDTLSAAYAEAGDFAAAVRWQQRAVELVPVAARGPYEARLDAYRDARTARASS